MTATGFQQREPASRGNQTGWLSLIVYLFPVSNPHNQHHQ